MKNNSPAGIRSLCGRLLLAAAWVVAAAAGRAADVVTVWPAPAGEKLSEVYSLSLEGHPAPVYVCRVSSVPFNQVWPGYQRPIDQTELAGFAHWGMSGPVAVGIAVKHPFTNVVVRPSRLGIHPTVSGAKINFTLPEAGQVTVELDGPHHALHLFADPVETGAPASGTAGVRYFGAGVHHPGKLSLQSGETLYVSGGAVVYAAVEARGASHVRILGRGIIDASGFERDKGGGCIRLTDCSDVKIDGVILRDPDVWCLSAFGCRGLEIADVKLIGLWRYNADGIDICNSQDVVIRNSFVRAFDDAIVLKGLNWVPGGFQDRPVRNIRARDLVIWCDWGRALEIGAETSAPEIADVRFQDCDVIRTTHIAMDIQCGDRALVHDIRYEKIRVETDDRNPLPRIQAGPAEHYVPAPEAGYVPDLAVILIHPNAYSKDAERGSVRDVHYTQVSVTGKTLPRSAFDGFDAQHDVREVWFENLRFNGRPLLDAAAARLRVGAHVGGVRFSGGGK